MPSNRPGVRRTGALTRRSIRRGGRPRPVPAPARDRLRYLRSPVTWLAGILLAVATVTFQDVLTGTVKAILPLDSIPDRLSPQDAIEVVEVENTKDFGTYLVRGDKDGRFAKSFDFDGPWRAKADIVDVGLSEWMISLRGRAAQQVRITDIVPELEGGRCSAPLSGSLALDPSQGEADVIPLQVTIDDPMPTIKAYKSNGEAAKPYFTGPKAKNITLNRNETEALLIEAHSKRGYCRWRYRIHYQVGGSTAEMVLSGPDGKPFELTGRLPDASGYESAYLPSYVCPSAGRPPGTWVTETGKEYARTGERGLCPKD
jgi:hypothetical protein